MSTNPLPGNPFATEDALYTEDANNSSVVNATIALAYEQRTANLIAIWTDPRTKMDEMSGINYGTLADQIKERLGLA